LNGPEIGAGTVDGRSGEVTSFSAGATGRNPPPASGSQTATWFAEHPYNRDARPHGHVPQQALTSDPPQIAYMKTAYM
jgi:hypothetical protein